MYPQKIGCTAKLCSPSSQNLKNGNNYLDKKEGDVKSSVIISFYRRVHCAGDAFLVSISNLRQYLIIGVLNKYFINTVVKTVVIAN